MLVLKDDQVLIDLSEVDLNSIAAEARRIVIHLPRVQKVTVEAPRCIPVRRSGKAEVRRGIC